MKKLLHLLPLFFILLLSFPVASLGDNSNNDDDSVRSQSQPIDDSSTSPTAADATDVSFFDASSRKEIWYGTSGQRVYVTLTVTGPVPDGIQVRIFRGIPGSLNDILYKEFEERFSLSSGQSRAFTSPIFTLDTTANYVFGENSGNIFGYWVQVRTVQVTGSLFGTEFTNERTIHEYYDNTVLSGELSMLDPYMQDEDEDSLSDGQELFGGTNTNFADPDTDKDGLADGYEVFSGLDPLKNDAQGDLDGDGLTNLEEYNLDTFANSTDSDGDGLNDSYEVFNELDPIENDAQEDFDGDGLTNLEEYNLGTFANNTDSDGDGLNDGYEVNDLMFDPLKTDSDGDGINDSEEAKLIDEDSDGIIDVSAASFHLFSLFISSLIVLAVSLILVRKARSKSRIDKI